MNADKGGDYQRRTKGGRFDSVCAFPGQISPYQYIDRAEGLCGPSGRWIYRDDCRKGLLCIGTESGFLSGRTAEKNRGEAIEIARASGIALDKLIDLLTLMYQEEE